MTPALLANIVAEPRSVPAVGETWYTSTAARRLPVAFAVALGLLYAVVARAGSAADEPAHFLNVQYYARHLSLPELGRPDVSYEGQMGPIYYEIAGPIYRVTARWGERAAFWTLRIVGLALFVPLVVLTRRVAGRAVPTHPGLAFAVTMFVAANPSLAAIGASVQNDMLAIVLCLWATDLYGRWTAPGTPLRPGPAIALAGVVSAAILTKATATYLAIAIPSSLLLGRRWRRAEVPAVAAFCGTVAVLTGWWFARNYLLYGDVSAQRGLTRFHYNNNPPPGPIWQPRLLARWVYGICSQYFVPTEYYRNTFRAPIWVRASTALAYALCAAGAIRLLFAGRRWGGRLTPFAASLAVQFAVCFGMYAYTCARVTAFASRCTYPTFLEFGLLYCGTLWVLSAAPPRSRERSTAAAAAVAGVGAFLLALNAFTLVHLWRMATYPFHLFV